MSKKDTLRKMTINDMVKSIEEDTQMDWSALIESAEKLAELKIEEPANG
jgi:hypothetical protein